jgi:signal transduction histidine kinase
MSVNSLRWVAVALPVAFVLFLLLTLDPWMGHVLQDWPATLVFLTALAVGASLFATAVFGWVDRSQRASDARAFELQALNELGNRLLSESTDEAAVRITLESAAAILDARAIGISVERRAGWLWISSGEWRQDLDELVVARRHAVAGSQPELLSFEDGRSALLLTAPLDGRGALYAVITPAEAETQTSATSLMDGLATHATLALERCLLLEEVQRREQRTRALYDVGLEIVSSRDLSHVLQQVTADACALVGARAAALCLVNDADGTLALAQTAGDAGTLSAAPLPGTDRDAGRRVPLIGGAAPTCASYVGGAGCLRSHLIVGSAVLGELCVAQHPDQSFSEDDRRLLAGLADMAAIAIHNSRLRDHERQIAILEERDHLAHEMHDTLAQVLGYLHLKAATVRKRIDSGEIARACDELQEMQDLANEAYVDVREAILGLRETVAPAGGIVGGLRQYLQKFSRQSGVDTRLYVPDAVNIGLSPEAEIQLLRVVQEALTNVRKHAQATSAAVRIDSEEGQVRVVIADDGNGFDASRVDRDEGRSFGLRSMRERVERAGGRLGVESTPGSGTRIIVLLPLNEGGRHVTTEGAAGR